MEDELGLDEILAAEEQRKRHEADPEHEPEFLPADAPGFETEAYTAGWQDEDA